MNDALRAALDELVSAVKDGRRRCDAGDGLAIMSNMIGATLRQAEQALAASEPSLPASPTRYEHTAEWGMRESPNGEYVKFEPASAGGDTGTHAGLNSSLERVMPSGSEPKSAPAAAPTEAVLDAIKRIEKWGTELQNPKSPNFDPIAGQHLLACVVLLRAALAARQEEQE